MYEEGQVILKTTLFAFNLIKYEKYLSWVEIEREHNENLAPISSPGDVGFILTSPMIHCSLIFLLAPILLPLVEFSVSFEGSRTTSFILDKV